jgi:putative flippase GtrA
MAALATAVNIACQALVTWLYHGPQAVPISVLFGTAAGVPVKYVIEKRYVFAFRSDNLRHDARLLVVYGFLGTFTTALFWGIEYAFHVLFATDEMRLLGGAIGLTVGYFIRYHLDKNFVFVLPSRRADTMSGREQRL